MRAKRVRIRNIMGIEDLEFEPGKITRIEGANASGKSSVLESLKSIIEGGHDATLLRKGEEEGEIVILLEDDVEVRKRVTADRSTLEVRHPEFGKISAPKTYIEKLVDPTAFNPVRFMMADDRVELLLEAVGTTISTEELEKAVGDVPFEELPSSFNLNDLDGAPALEAIETVRKAIFSARTGVNRILRDKSTTAEELKSSLPADGAAPSEVQSELRDAEKALEEERDEQRAKVQEKEDEAAKEIREIEMALDERVAELRDMITKAKEEAQEKIDQVRAEKEEAVQKVRDGYSEEIDRWVETVGSLRERARAVDDAARSRRLITEAEAEAQRRKEQSDALTAALERLEGLKVEAMESIPIEGAEIQDGELYVDGVAFDRLNSARKTEIVLEIAKVRAGDLGLVIVDDLELLDEDHFQAMVEGIEASDLQAIVTRVRDGAPLTISTDREDG